MIKRLISEVLTLQDKRASHSKEGELKFNNSRLTSYVEMAYAAGDSIWDTATLLYML